MTILDALCDTTTSFDDEPCDHQKEGSCPRAVESDTLGEREKKDLQEKENLPKLYNLKKPNSIVKKLENLSSNFTKEIIIYKSK